MKLSMTCMDSKKKIPAAVFGYDKTLAAVAAELYRKKL